MKNYTDEAKTQKKINVKKVVSLKDVLSRSFDELKFKINDVNQIDDLKFLSKKDAKTEVEISFLDKDKKLTFKLKDKRKVDRETINLLKNKDISSIIS